MKTWIQNRRLRKQRSEATLPVQRYESIEVDEIISPMRLLPPISKRKNAARISAPSISSRMSMDRYLNAPLSDEPASVPAITAALKKQASHSSLARAAQAINLHHSRETSADANSDGRQTFFTTGSAPETVDTSYTTHLKMVPQRKVPQTTVAIPTTLQRQDSQLSGVSSPERPTTSATVGPVDMAKNWAEQMEKYMPGYSPDKRIDYRAKAEEEIARIQEKARELEERLKLYKDERNGQDVTAPIVTDDMAYAQMAAHPKLAWILGGDPTDVNNVGKPKSVANTTEDIPDRPRTSGRTNDIPKYSLPRRSKSSGALDERARQDAVDKMTTRPIERKPSKRPKFYCTFCHKRFHSRLEWMRHEQTIHMPEELWICCPRTGEFPRRCPFCEKSDPSPSHLTDHNYLSCQGKPLSERTFGRKDHFLQHISQVHKVSPGQKPARLTELVEAWRHPLPLKEGHQALHCGFCGSTFATYQDRTKHVSQHFIEGLDMISWWKDRVSHDVQFEREAAIASKPDAPHKCAYCERTYESLDIAQQFHPVCSMWSCSFIPGIQYTIYPASSQSEVAAVCCYCNDTLVHGDGKVKGAILKDHLVQHNFRKCNQRLYFSGQRFRQHLQDSHKTTFDATLFAGWTLLLKSSRKDRPSLFRQTETATAARRVNTDPGSTTKKGEPQETPSNFMDLTDIPQRVEPAKLRRKASTQTVLEQPAQEIRDSTQFFTRSATIDFAHGLTALPSPRIGAVGVSPTKSKPRSRSISMPVDAINAVPRFYRRRLDASTRNRIYLRERDETLSKNSQHLYRQIPRGVLGGLVLHSSMVGSVPARLTNSVDIYSLH
ncbi:Nn.00g055620.m01.CDS01 [Neocucurbitaria sp. VM-36]